MKAKAFTLLEVLVAMVVLISLCLLLSRVASDTQSIVGQNVRRLDADAQAQLIFDRIYGDIVATPIREDVPISLNTTGASSELVLYSRVPSESGDRGLSKISYKIDNDKNSGAPIKKDRPALLRASKGLSWSDKEFMGRMPSGTVVPVDYSNGLKINDSDYDVLSYGVLKMYLACQLSDGSISALPPSSSGNVDVHKVRAIVATIVVLDEKTAGVISASQIQDMAARFSSPANNQLPLADWNAIAENPANFTGLPHTAAKGIRVYQRFFTLKP